MRIYCNNLVYELQKDPLLQGFKRNFLLRGQRIKDGSGGLVTQMRKGLLQSNMQRAKSTNQGAKMSLIKELKDILKVDDKDGQMRVKMLVEFSTQSEFLQSVSFE